MNRGTLDGMHRVVPPVFRQQLIGNPNEMARGGTSTGVGVPLICSTGPNLQALANVANRMYLGLTYIPETWVMQEFELYYAQQAQTSGTKNDIVIYECADDGLPGQLVGKGHVENTTQNVTLQCKGSFNSLSVPYSGLYWAGLFHPVGGQIQYAACVPHFGLHTMNQVSGKPDGLIVEKVPTQYVEGKPPEDLSGCPFNSGTTSVYSCWASMAQTPAVIVRGTNR